MIRAALALVVVIAGCGDSAPEGRYRDPATPETLAGWQRDYAAKRDLVPDPPSPSSESQAIDFSGRFRFGPWDYPLSIEQSGDRVSFRSGGVDRQEIGGAWETVGTGVVRDGVLRARWWCFDLSRNYANNGGCEMRFIEEDKLHVEYYHDADERIEEGYGVRVGTHAGEDLHYRIRIPHPDAGPAVVKGRVRGRDGEAIRVALEGLSAERRARQRPKPAAWWRTHSKASAHRGGPRAAGA